VKFKIYTIENQINGKIYIGKTSKSIEERWEDHLKKVKEKVNRYLYDSINKYGSDNFIIKELDSTDDPILINEMESWYIYIFNSKNPEFGYNMTFGGDGGNTISNFTEERRKEYLDKLTKSLTGRKFSEEVKKKMSDSKKGSTLSEETRKKISKTTKDRIKNGTITINTSGLWKGQKIGFKHSEEAKEKISFASKGKKYEDIYGEELAKEKKERKSLQYRGENNPLYRKIDKNELLKKIKELPYLKDVAVYFLTSPQTISNKCKEYFNKKYTELKNGNN
jgi:group I intron endonuclease